MFWLYLVISLVILLIVFIIFLGMINRLFKSVIVEKPSNVIVEGVADKSSSVIMERAIREGLKSAIRELDSERQIERDILDTLKNKDKDTGIYTSIENNDAPVKHSGGNLVPFGLSENEKKILEMFYGND